MSRSGRYELLRLLARGGMAEVFLARRRAAGVEKILVIKRIRPERTGDLRFLDLFVREARLSMSLAHQNIVPVFDFGRSGDQVYLAMERIEGKDLGSSLLRGATLPPLLAAYIGAECCRALAYAHARKGSDGQPLGVIHRDVTPRNVLLSWSGEVKLTDFGIAALTGDASASLLGTAAYMAPEQARGEPLDVRADLYALGLVLREALSGARPRSGNDRDAMVAAAREGVLVPWDTNGIAPELAAIVERTTAADREARYPDARALLAALDAYIVGERAANRREAPEQQLAAWLATTWVGELDEPAFSADETIDFEVEDLGAIGTGTEHSLARTAAEVPTPPPPEPAPAPVVAAAPSPNRARYAVLAAGVLAASTAAWLVWPAPHVPEPPLVAAVVVRPDAGQDRAAAAAPVAIAPVPAPAPVVRSAPVDRARARRPAPPAAAPAPAPAPVATRRATINATPWAYFTIDGDAARHTTVETLDLAIGEHHLHFWNPELKLERDATVVVEADRDLRFVMPLR